MQNGSTPAPDSDGAAASTLPGAPQDSSGDGTGTIQRPPKASVLSGFLSLIAALLVVLAVRSMVFEPFKIPSGSMMPTLLKGDHIFVKKFAYALRAPFTDFFGPGTALAQFSTPSRGDIVVFRYPKDESTHFIKRVIGLPGDTIEVKNKNLIINGKQIARDPLAADSAKKISEQFDDARYRSPSIDFFTEHLDKVDHVVMIDRGNFLADGFGPVTVPADSLFVMGDNRDYSNDSRFWGFVPMKNVTGKAMFIWMSFFYDRTEGSAGFHPDRIGTNLR